MKDIMDEDKRLEEELKELRQVPIDENDRKRKRAAEAAKNGKTQGISLCSRIYGSCGRRSGRTGRRLLRMGLGTALYGRS